MAKQFPNIDKTLQDFIEAQHMFFVATAAQGGRVNLSPKDNDSLRVLGPNRILWRNLTGSGNETAGHLAQVNRITMMWCSFTTRPLILRIFGSARTLHPRDAGWDTLNAHFGAALGARQLFDVSVDMAQTSCGYGVPFYDHAGPRDTLEKWAQDRGEQGIHSFWSDSNQTTIDGLPTGILKP